MEAAGATAPDSALRGVYSNPGASVDARRFMELALTLAINDFKMRYFGSALGYLWSLLRPLMFFAVLYFVFTRVVRFGGAVAHYPEYLLMSVVIFTYFSETTGAAVGSLVGSENLIRKIRFPLAVIPVSIALTAAFNLALNLIVVFGFVLASGIAPRADWLEMPLILGMLLVSTMGVSMILAALFVRFRDLGHIWSVVSQVIFYASPIIYPIEFLRGATGVRLERILMALNPIVPPIQEARHAIVDPGAQGVSGVMDGMPLVLLPFLTAAGLFALGLWLFNREAPTVAENV